MIVDPITLEVVRSRLDAIANEMESTLLKSAFSSIVKEAADASAAIFDCHGNTIAQAIAIPSHLGMLGIAVRRMIEHFPAETMLPGDIYIHNEPYDAGTHLPDITILTPVYHDGRVVALSASMAHHQDIGGKAPGSTAADATEMYAEGLIVPAMKLYDRGDPVEQVHQFLRANSRIPDVLIGDINAQIACVNTGKRRIIQMFEEFGMQTVLDCMLELLDHAERLARAEVEAVPDGDYTFYDYLDGDGISAHKPIKVQATIQKRGSQIHIDFTGTDPAVQGAVNCVPSPRRAMEYFMLKAICKSDLPNNDGCYRLLTSYAPEGTLVNPRPPRAVNARAVTMKRVVSVLLGAMAQAAPANVPAASDGQTNVLAAGGINPRTGQTYVTCLALPFAGALGGRPTKDGVDVITTDLSNTLLFPVEPFEMEFPFRIENLNLWRDSGGPGKFRGGLGYHGVCRLLEGDATLVVRHDRHDFAPWGLFGGKSAPCCRIILVRADGSREDLPSKMVVAMKAGDCIDVYTTGGGGYGDPLERDPWRVLDDVLDFKVSLVSAERDYGVVISDETVDDEATRRLRAELKAERGAITWTYDRGRIFSERTGLSQYQ